MTRNTPPASPEEPVSHHIFLLPFRWDYYEANNSDDIPFTERTDLKQVKNLFEKKNITRNGERVYEPHRYWKRYFFAINQARDYNEIAYFYDSVRRVIFDNDDSDDPDKDRILLQYDYQYTKATYHIVVHDERAPNKEKEYILPVTDIVLNFYQSGVAIISIHLDNFDYKDPSDILKINETGRRIYPPFLGDRCDQDQLTSKPMKIGRMAKMLKLKLDNVELTETFQVYNTDLKQVQKKPEQMPRLIHDLLGPHFIVHQDDRDPKSESILIHPLIDDRMFTICWYGNEEKSKSLGILRQMDAFQYDYEIDPWWHSFMFVDGSIGGNLANKRLRMQLNQQHTYDRWVEYGTLYGITRYSFVAMSGPSFGHSDLLPNMQTMYFQLVMLALIQRASLIRFAEEATSLASLELKGVLLEENVQGLYEKYLKFVNKMHFMEVTAQEQGIDLYSKLIEFIHLEKEVVTTNREIDELYKYASLKAEENTRKRLTQLTILVSVFTIPSFLLSYYGMDFVKQAATNSEQDSTIERTLETHVLWVPIVILLLFALSILYFREEIERYISSEKKSKGKKSKNNLWLLTGLLLVVLFLLMAPWLSRLLNW